MKRIVVGTDGSKNAKAALEWAIEFARMQGATLRVVHTWQYPYVASEAAAYASPEPKVFQESAEALLAEALADVDTNGVTIEPVAREGGAAHILLEEAGNADMLVVGMRGHGGFAGLLLGSVSSQCVRHPTVPTVVVPAR